MEPMKQFVSKQTLSIYGWLSGAILILGVNGNSLLSIQRPPDTSNLRQSKITEARQKAEQLEKLLVKARDDAMRYEEAASRISTFFSAINDRPPAPDANVEETKPVEITPPVVSGIMRMSGVRGNMNQIAVVEGKGYREHQRVQGFTIKQISEKGVSFLRDGKSWFVATPVVDVSQKSSEKREIPTQETSSTSPPEAAAKN